MTALAKTTHTHTHTHVYIDPRASFWAAPFSRRTLCQGIQGTPEQQKGKNGQVSQVPAVRMDPSVEGSRVRTVMSSSGSKLGVVRKHMEAMVFVTSVFLIWRRGVVVKSGVVMTVDGSTVVGVVKAVGLVVVVLAEWQMVVECVVVGTVTNRRYVWYQMEIEEDENTTGIASICPFLCVSAASPNQDH